MMHSKVGELLDYDNSKYYKDDKINKVENEQIISSKSFLHFESSKFVYFYDF
jgi:hypothetical protein